MAGRAESAKSEAGCDLMRRHGADPAYPRRSMPLRAALGRQPFRRAWPDRKQDRHVRAGLSTASRVPAISTASLAS